MLVRRAGARAVPAATGVEYSPFGGWSLPIRLSVQATLSQGLVAAENMTVVQTAKPGGTDAL